ncbi:hypothetical protein EDD85DRAFT_970789 [Armillaria nabsnona]|nr:hypothetical protein EDD85DRAFT_970789 [Armillaria nabsnona]
MCTYTLAQGNAVNSPSQSMAHHSPSILTMLTRNNACQCRKYASIPILTHPRSSRINIEGNRLRAQYPLLVETMNKPWDVLSLSICKQGTPIHRKPTAMATYWTTTTGDDAKAAKVKEGHVTNDSHHPVSTITSLDHSTSSGGGMALSTLLQEIQSSGEVDIGRYRHIYGFTVNAEANQRISINVIGAVSDILIAASPFISCSIPGTTCRRSGMVISKLDCVFEWYLPISPSPPNLCCPNSSPYPSNLSSSGLRTPVGPNIFRTATYRVPASEVNGSGNNVLKDRRRRGGPWERRSALIARPFPLCATTPASLIARRDTSGVSMPARVIASPQHIDVQRRENELGKTQKWQASSITSGTLRQIDHPFTVTEVCADSYRSHLWMFPFGV